MSHYEEIRNMFYEIADEMGVKLPIVGQDADAWLLQYHGFIEAIWAISRRVYVPKDIIKDEIRQYLKEWVD